MDIVAHGLWVGIGLAAAGRSWRIKRRTAVATLGLAVVPDLAQLLPLIAGTFEPGGVAVLTAYVSALPGFEPHLPPLAALLTHHLHCIMHSAVVAGVVTGVVWFFSRTTLWLPLLGWWSHIVIDVFTHSADFYAVPVLYPFTQRGFDGLAWNTPWFFALNYAAIALAAGCLAVMRKRGPVV